MPGTPASVSRMTLPNRRDAFLPKSFAHELEDCQTEFLSALADPAILTAVLSLPRGSGKSTLAGGLVAGALTPGNPLWREGSESVLVAASLDQVRRTTFRQARHFLTADSQHTAAYRFAESNNAVHIVHRDTGTRVTALGANPKTAQGLVGCPLVVCDEPGAWEVAAGEAMHSAITTAQGKVGSPMRVVYVGTLAPAMSGWWHDLVRRGSHGSAYVVSLEGDPARWSEDSEIARCNPLLWRYPESRKVLLEERDAALGDSRLKAQFLSFRLNVPSADESTVLLSVSDWQRVIEREPVERAARPIVGVDLGAGRAWSAAVAVWPNGRTEAAAVTPGIPSVEEQERRDRVPAGTYARLVDSGRLTVAEGLRVPPPRLLLERAKEWGGRTVICDRFRLGELQDSMPSGVRVVPRVTRWSEAAADVRALRKMAKDGPLWVEPSSRPLLEASLAAATVKSDDQGNTRLEKRGHNNEARDDVAAALLLAAGAVARLRPERTGGAVVCGRSRKSVQLT